MFVELHEKGTNYPILVKVNAIDTVVIENMGRMTDPTTILTIGSEKYEVIESYEQIFRMLTGCDYEWEGAIDNGGDSAE